MDENLVKLYSDEYRKERKLNYQLGMDLQQCQMLMNDMNKDLSKFTALEYVRTMRDLDELREKLDESNIKVKVWNEAREIAMDYKGDVI